MKKDQAERFCQIQGHQQYAPTHICTLKKCEQISRWVCNQCFISGTHNHKQNNNTHLMNQQQFIDFISQIDDQDQYQLEQVLQYKQPLNQLLEAIKQLEIFWQDYIQQMDYSIQNQIYRQAKIDFYSINNDQITKILSKLRSKSIKFDFQQFLKNIQQIRIQSYEIEEQIQHDIEQIDQNIDNQSYDFVDYARFESNDLILTSEISWNERYLAYGGFNKQLVIYDLNTKIIINKFEFKDIISVCRFSQDSNFLFTGFDNGYLNCLELNNVYEEKYHKQIHKEIICNIIVQSNQVIITIDKTDILVTDIYKNQQILKIGDVHSNLINGLDYSLLNDVIVSGSFDRSIKLFNLQSGKLLIQKELAHDDPIQKIQLQNNKLLSLCQEGILKYWQIDYTSMKLQLKLTIKDDNNIKTFDFVNDKLIVLICNKCVQLFTEDLVFFKKVNQTQNDEIDYNRTNQLKNMNYLIFTGLFQFTVMQRI